MCGIAGYSVSPESELARTLAAQTLLAGIAERGADAVGYAYRVPEAARAIVVKQRTAASELLDRVSVPVDTTDLLVHVRDYTKGHPSIAANNHPIRHGRVVGIHNGIIVNDDELLAEHTCARAEPRMTVDSEAIFALAAHSGNDPRALEDLHGSMAAAWLDEREPGQVFLARGVGRPLWIGQDREGIFFASTKLALEVVEHFCRVKLQKRQIGEGTLLTLNAGEIVARQRFRPNTFVEEGNLPAVRAPQEREFCLTRLASIAAAA